MFVLIREYKSIAVHGNSTCIAWNCFGIFYQYDAGVGLSNDDNSSCATRTRAMLSKRSYNNSNDITMSSTIATTKYDQS